MKHLLLIILSVLPGLTFANESNQQAHKQMLPINNVVSSPETLTEIRVTTRESDTLLVESFEDVSAFSNWTVTDQDGDGNAWMIYVEQAPGDTVAHSGIQGVGILYNATGNDDWLITPQLSIPTGSTVEFSFWAHSYSSTYLEDFNVKLSTSGTSTTDFTVSLDAVTNVPYGWTQYSYDLSAYAGQTIYLAIQCVSVDDWYLFADDFLVVSVPTSGGFTDGWNIIDAGTSEDLNDVLFLDNSNGFVVGNGGVLMKTYDGGSTWESIDLGISNDLNGIDFLNDMVGFIVGSWVSGNSSPIFKTTDGGLNWTLISSSTTRNLLSVDIIDANTIFAVGWSLNEWSQYMSKLLRSTDGGENWEELSHPLDGYNVGMEEVAFANAQNGYIAANGHGNSASALVYTHDGGATWSMSTNSNSLYSVYFVNESIGFYGGGSALYKTEDVGSTWSSVIYPGFYGVNDINFFDVNTGFLVGYNGRAAYSTDGGIVWNADYSPLVSGELNSADFISDFLVCTVGDDGTVFIYKIGETVGIENNLVTITDYKLSQNYPNPFNPETMITYSIPLQSQVELIIYDVRGRHVATLVNSLQTSGSHAVTWSGMDDKGNSVSAGVYFYQLTGENYRSTGKMLLLK